MSPSYADNIDKIIKHESDQVSDRSTAEWKTNDLKTFGIIAGDVSFTYQVYVRGALTAAEAWTMLEGHFNKKTLMNRLLVSKKLNYFKMEPGTNFATHVDQFKEIVLQMETIGETLDETRQLVLLLGSLTDEYKMICTVLENTPNVSLAYAIQAISGVQALDESSSVQEKAFVTKKKDSGGKRRFNGKCFYCKKRGHREFECRKKKSDQERGQAGTRGSVQRFLVHGYECDDQDGDEVCHAATTTRKEPWAVVHALFVHIPFKRYERLLTMADEVPRITGSIQTRTPSGYTYVVTLIDDYSRHVTVHFMKAAMENATRKTIKRMRSDNGGEYTGHQFMAFLNQHGIKHEKTVAYTFLRNGLAERMNRGLVVMARGLLYHESVNKKWWAEAVNNAAWIINRIPISVTEKIPYEIIYKSKLQLKNVKLFGAIGYAHITNEKRRKPDAKAFKCFL
ncbi:hypothetical protein PHMEG_00012083 [Phytophthora megakarya]|uniref:Integrase catalytic domain-containing protein n=1 Tax=Phytophthora megakarya TaxID=4795 RepID=A0A225W9N2_9STRA|nr:hypothetical protein PHMEG_00012083 [Phytophthora megakarya]